MIRTKQLVKIEGQHKWVYGWTSRNFRVGDRISFTCNGRGRGGHFLVTAVIQKVNRKTLDAVEAEGSYKPGTLWRISQVPKDFTIYVELPPGL